ncbi:MAG: hypothetical protein U0736_05785 [Gemmataceae bacterium]
MTLSTRLRLLSSLRHPSTPRRAPAGHRQRLWLERLEDRTTPTGTGTLSLLQPAGAEFPINQYTGGDQYNSPQAIASSASGVTVVTWTSAGQDGSGLGVYARRYGGDGPLGNEFRVNTTTDGNQADGFVAMNAAGAFVITWTSDWQDGSYNGVYGQRYDAAGHAVGGEFQINTYTALWQARASPRWTATAPSWSSG